MLKKSLGFLTLAGLAGSLTFGGCSNGPTLAPTDGGATDATADTSTPTKDASKDVKEAAPSCSVNQDLFGVLFKETSPPAKAQGLCTSKQIDDYHALCYGGADAGDQCQAFYDAAANKACLGCLRASSEDKTRPAPVIYPVTEKLVQANTTGCGYLVVGKPECANNAVRYIMCYRSVCGDCTKGSDDETACQKDAKENLCKQYEATKDCQDAYTAGKTAIDATCVGTTSDFKGNYLKVANYMCGGTTDGGVTDAALPMDAPAD